MNTFDLLYNINVAKMNSKVYRGFRYYVCGETYFCAEVDTACEFAFTRVCVDLPNPEKYIDDNFDALNLGKKNVILELQEELDSLNTKKKEIAARISHLNSLKCKLPFSDWVHLGDIKKFTSKKEK